MSESYICSSCNLTQMSNSFLGEYRCFKCNATLEVDHYILCKCCGNNYREKDKKCWFCKNSSKEGLLEIIEWNEQHFKNTIDYITVEKGLPLVDHNYNSIETVCFRVHYQEFLTDIKLSEYYKLSTDDKIDMIRKKLPSS